MTREYRRSHPLRSANPYGSSPVACEQALSDIAATDRLRYAALRYFNAAGADPASGIGEAHVPETHLIPLAVRAVRDPRFTLDAFGQDFHTRDSTAVTDYIHVDDLADAHVRALERLPQGAPALVPNLGTGTGTSVREVIDACTRGLDREPKHRIAARAHAELGWTPSRSDIDSLVRSAGAWDSMLPGG